MTYASQVRAASKPIPQKVNEEEKYDVNSLRIICKYFVGSVVKVKTIHEEIEGVFHTLYQSKICLSLVTISDSSNVSMITSTHASKMINLSDIVSITASNISEQQDVTIKDKLIKLPPPQVQVTGTSQSPVQPNTPPTTTRKQNKTPLNNLKYANVVISTPLNDSPKLPLSNKNTNNEELSTTTTTTPNSTSSNKPVQELADKENSDSAESLNDSTKKSTFSFNPNAPEFKPRFFNTNYPPNILTHESNLTIFPPPTVQSPPLISPNTVSSAVFIPNYILLNSQQIAAQQQYQESKPDNQVHATDSISNNTDNNNNDNRNPKLPYYSPISFFVPNTSILQLSNTIPPLPSNTEHLRHHYHEQHSYPVTLTNNMTRQMKISESSSDDCTIQISHNVAYNFGSGKKRDRAKQMTTNHNTTTDTTNNNTNGHKQPQQQQNGPELTNLSDWPPLPEPNKNSKSP